MTTPTQRKPYRKLHSEDNDLILKMLARMQPLSIIAKSLKCDRRTLAKHIKANPDLDEAFKESYERLSDLAESKLLEKINAGDLQAIIFYLERRCAHRGWSKTPLPIRDPSQERIIFIGQPPKPPPPRNRGFVRYDPRAGAGAYRTGIRGANLTSEDWRSQRLPTPHHEPYRTDISRSRTNKE